VIDEAFFDCPTDWESSRAKPAALTRLFITSVVPDTTILRFSPRISLMHIRTYSVNFLKNEIKLRIYYIEKIISAIYLSQALILWISSSIG
jgi:hypothetical protein